MDDEVRSRRAPPPEAYSRVTNPERFRPLHAHALDLLARLEAAYDVVRSAAFAPLPGVFSPDLPEQARPPVTLTPAAPRAAPLAVAFNAQPSLLVRAGRWYGTAFPVCACDACGADTAEEARRLDELVGHVVAGHFDEEVRLPLFGEARLLHAFGARAGSGSPSPAGWGVIPRALARSLARGGPRRIQWRPWPRREPGPAAGAPAA